MSQFEFQLVLPCYNESKSLKVLIERAISAAREAGFTCEKFQLVLVENGSKDDSFQILEALKKTDLGAWFQIVRIFKNQGYGYGLWQGLQATNAQYIGWTHADQQCDPTDAFKALKILRGQTSLAVVKGVRQGRNWKDIFVSRVFELFAWLLLGARIYEINAQPKIFPQNLKAEILNPPKDFAFDVYVLFRALRAGYCIHTISVHFPPRIHGASNWAAHFVGRYRTILNMIAYMWKLGLNEGRVWSKN